MIILDEMLANAQFRKRALVIAFEEESTLVGKSPRLKDKKIR